MEQVIFFATLALFPLGQLVKIGFINPIDVLVMVASLITFLKEDKKPYIYKYFYDFSFVASFTFLLALPTLGVLNSAQGLLYLARLISYFYFINFLFHLKDKKGILNLVLGVITASAVFGWIQYFRFFDLTFLKWLNWDDHLYRLVGTFLDPTFTSIIFVIGFVTALYSKKYLISFFLLISTIYTYSRAGYLALLIGLIFYLIYSKKVKVFLLSLLSFILVFITLPTRPGEGANLARTASVNARLLNYKQGFDQFIKNPVFGVGFNNLCVVRKSTSHSCSAYDAVILTILTTTGVAGLFSFIRLIYELFVNTNSLFKTVLVSIATHSFFGNSLFYSWVLYLLIVILSVSLNKERKL